MQTLRESKAVMEHENMVINMGLKIIDVELVDDELLERELTPHKEPILCRNCGELLLFFAGKWKHYSISNTNCQNPEPLQENSEPKTILQITDCKKCGKQYVVGINGKDIRNSETSGGKAGDIPFMAIGNDELEKAKYLSELIDCKNCGNICEVINMRSEPPNEVKISSSEKPLSGGKIPTDETDVNDRNKRDK